MKQLFILVLLFCALCANAQNVKQDANGNFYQVKQTTAAADKPTGKTFTTAKGETFPVYISSKGRLYVIRKSKTGNTYKQYLKV